MSGLMSTAKQKEWTCMSMSLTDFLVNRRKTPPFISILGASKADNLRTLGQVC